MRKIFFLMAVFVCIAQSSLYAQRIFITDSINNADIKVYVTTDSTTADLKVCMVDSAFKVYKDGIWYLVNQVQQSKLSVKIVNNPLDADFRIFYVSNSRNAGWINSNIKYYYRRKK